MKQGLLFVMVFMLAGCVSTNVQKYAEVDHSEKTITVPPGSLGLTGKIKSRLTQAGWRLVIYAGPKVTKGTAGSDVNLETSDTFNSRYLLAMDWVQFDLCLNLQPAIRYDLSVIDNRSGSEVVTMSGEDCETEVADKFVAQLK